MHLEHGRTWVNGEIDIEAACGIEISVECYAN
jgi:hypothetical protein